MVMTQGEIEIEAPPALERDGNWRRSVHFKSSGKPEEIGCCSQGSSISSVQVVQ
jgi:hypothetical protein